MELKRGVPPSAEELQAYCVGRCDADQAARIEAYLADGLDCGAILAAAPDDGLLRHLRGAGALSAHEPHRNGTAADTHTTDSDYDAGSEDTFDTLVVSQLDHPRYRIIRKLGQGGMGAVFLAEHRLMHRSVAIKCIRPICLAHPQLVARFRLEVQAAARLSHPHIVTALDADQAGDTHFLVMEYVEGETLAQRLARRGPFAVAEACDCIRQAALGLQHAHDRGMVHRDLKPHNLMLHANPPASAQRVVKILDFGLARVLRESEAAAESLVTLPGTLMGTADYVAPEQARDSRQADIRADIYSLGCTLYHLLTGWVPFPGGTTIEKILQHATASPRSVGDFRNDVPPGLVAILDRMMAKNPADRFQTPGEVAAALGAFAQPGAQSSCSAETLTGCATVTSPLTPMVMATPEKRKRRGRHTALLAAAVVGGLLTMGVMLWLVLTQTHMSSADLTTQASEDETEENFGLVRVLPYPGQFPGVGFSPNGKLLLGGGFSHYATVWELTNGKSILTLPGTSGWHKTAFMPDSQRVLALHADKLFRTWNIESQECEKLPQLDFNKLTAKLGKEFTPWAVSADGKFLALNFSANPKSHGYFLANLASGEELLRILPIDADSAVGDGLFSTDGTRYFTVDLYTAKSTFRVWDVAAGKLIRSFTVPWHSNGRQTLRQNGKQVGVPCTAGEKGYSFGFWDVDTGELVHDIRLTVAHGPSYSSVSADGRWYSLAYPKKNFVDFYDLNTGELILHFDAISTPGYAAFSPDGQHAVVPGEGGLWLFRLTEAPQKNGQFL